LATVLAGLTPNFLSLFSMRLLAGFFSGGIIPLCLALVGDLVAINRRQVAISRFATATVGGQIFGAVLSGLFAPLVGWRGVMIGAGAFSMTCAILLAITARGGNDGRRPFSLNSVLTGYRRVFANPSAIPLYTIVCFEGMIIYGTFPYIAAILERQSGLGPVEAGLIVGAYGSGGLAFAVASGWLVGRLGPAHFFVLGGILMAIANFMLAFEIHWHILGVFFVGYGFGFFCFHSRLQTIATELSSENRGASVGFFASSLFVGVAIGPMLFSLLLRVFGETGALFATASAILILASAAIRMLR
jgi:predicted MFS family arabinose efflux permease